MSSYVTYFKLIHKPLFASRSCFQNCGQRNLQIPIVGEYSILAISIFPFPVIFAVLWVIYRKSTFGWIGQDILVRYLQPQV